MDWLLLCKVELERVGNGMLVHVGNQIELWHAWCIVGLQMGDDLLWHCVVRFGSCYWHWPNPSLCMHWLRLGLGKNLGYQWTVHNYNKRKSSTKKKKCTTFATTVYVANKWVIGTCKNIKQSIIVCHIK